MTKTNENKNVDLVKKQKCGIIMPISEIDGCTSEHWSDVLAIIQEVVTESDFIPNLVSDSDDIGIIQKRIVQNIYNNPIVICDVSGKNPNVMFELGMRLAFDKATIIIKDDKTDFSFDTSLIEHVGYPRDLRFNKMIEFKETLKIKLKATYEKSISDPHYSTFLKSFGQFKIAKLEEQEVTPDQYILESLSDLKSEMRRLRLESQDNIHRRKQMNHNEIEGLSKESIINNGIVEFMMKNNIKSINTLKKSPKKVMDYLVDRSEMPDYFNQPGEVRELAEKVLSEL